MVANNGAGGRNSSSTAGDYGGSALLGKEGKEYICWVYFWQCYTEDSEVVRVMLNISMDM